MYVLMILTLAGSLQTVVPFESARICRAEAARLTIETERPAVCVPQGTAVTPG